MLKLSKQTRYALRALAFLAQQRGFCSTKKIAGEENIPRPYLEKILLKLKRKGLLAGKRGKEGGFKLKKQTLNLSLRQIIEALEENKAQLPCEVYICDKAPHCPSRKAWQLIKREFFQSLSKLSLKQILLN